MKSCSVCDEPHYALGYCRKHWRRFRTHGSPHFVMRPFKAEGTCIVPGCDEDYYAHGLCNAHWQRMRRNGNLLDYWLSPLIRSYQFQKESI